MRSQHITCHRQEGQRTSKPNTQKLGREQDSTHQICFIFCFSRWLARAGWGEGLHWIWAGVDLGHAGPISCSAFLLLLRDEMLRCEKLHAIYPKPFPEIYKITLSILSVFQWLSSFSLLLLRMSQNSREVMIMCECYSCCQVFGAFAMSSFTRCNVERRGIDTCFSGCY